MSTKSVTETINTDYKEYAQYVLSNRAIPCYIDGFKPVARKLLYAMLNQHKGKRTKVSDLGGISSLNYHHGEASAMGAAIGLAADWSNNVPIFEQHGAFGSRLIPEPAAPRYIFASLNKSFYNYFTDFDVLDRKENDEDPEPKTYLPNVPWVLINGVKGIAIGFACEYLSHDPKDIAAACVESLKGTLESDRVIIPSFPGFHGQVEVLAHDKFNTIGTATRTKRNTWEITELPWGVTREKYFNILSKMEDDGDIVDFEDNCSDRFNFIVKVDTKTDKTVAADPIKFFKLAKSYTENYTALDENGELVLFETKVEIINSFIEFRLKKVQEQLDFEINKLTEQLKFLVAKLQFVKDVLDDKIDFRAVTKKQLTSKVKTDYNISIEYAQRIISIPIADITKDMVKTLSDRIKKLEADKKVFENTDAGEVLEQRLTDIVQGK